MHFTDIFIRRPVLATVISLLILLVGVRSLQLLNVRQFPKTTNAVVTVSTVYIGASADLVQGFITTKLESQIATADGIDYLESSSVQGASTITAHLRLNYDPNDALTQITSKVNQVVNELPPEAEQPTINVAVGETTASMYIAFYSDVMQSNQITDYLLRVIQPRLATIPGVQEAEILGGRTFAMRIWLEPDKMAALGVAPADVRAVLAENNYLTAVGKTKGPMISVPLQASTDLHTVEEFRKLVIRREEGATIRIQDIATVELGAQDYDASVRFNGTPANFIGIKVLPTANPLTVVRDVKKMLPEIEAQAPPGLKVVSPYDVTEYINLSIKEVLRTLVEALLIVMVVIYLFLGSLRTVLIPVLAIPLSLIGTAFFMLLLGFSINLLTLLAMVLAIGLVVDDAIVVVENIERHIEEGLAPFDAALRGARELGGPVIAMTVTLAAVYAPIGFMGGLTGTLFTEFAFTLAGAVLVSGVMALTLSPMLCSRMLKSHTKKTGLVHFLDVSFDRLRRVYQAVLARTLNFRPVVMAFAGLILVSCYFLFSMARVELAPDEDQGFLLVQMTGPPNASIDYMDRYGQVLSNLVSKVKESTQPFLILGGGGGMAATINSGFTGINLVPWDQRERSQMEIAPEIQGMIGQISGLQSVVFPLPPLPAGGGGLPVQFVIGSTDPPLAIYERAQDLLHRAQASGLFMFADVDLKYDLPQTVLEIDRDKAADLGLDMRQVGADLASMVGGNYVNFFSIQGRSYRVIPQVERSKRLNPDQLNRYYIRAASGAMVPLSTIVSMRSTVEPEQLLRFQQLNSATISGVPAPGVTMGQVLDYMRTQAAEVLPQGYSIDYAGQSRQFMQESGGLTLTFFFALIVIFLVLSALFESFRDPLVMLITVPMSIFGALLFLALGFATLNIYTQVGLITLIGLISKHGILIVQFANQLQEQEGMAKRDAIENAASIRLRPILMTTAAMILGVMPLLLASGPGSVSRFDIGLVISSGLAIGTLFTLFVVPTMYMVLAKDHAAAAARAAEIKRREAASGVV